MVAIKVSHLSYTYPGKAATAGNSGISFEVQRSEIFGLLGPNGAGKTMLISQILGLIKPHAGGIWLENIDIVQNPDAAKRMVGFLPQTGLPMRYVEVEQALRWTGRLRGQTASAAQAQADTLIEQLEMSAYARKYVNKLSGGMLRLVNFAMSLMGEPPILALDEPANELDPQMRRRVWDMIAWLNRKRSTTCVVTSVLFLVVMAAPVFIPITALPLPLQFLSYAFSPTYAADALRRLLLGDVNLSFYLDMGMLALMGVVSFYLFKRWSFWRLQ